MNRTLGILLLAGAFTISLNLAAQQQKTAKPDQATAPHRRPSLPLTYLGNSELHGGSIRKTEFDRLLKEGLQVRDSAGNKYKVLGFYFNYTEKSLVEDSLGNNIIATDNLAEYCNGNNISPNLAATIYDRTKSGDSVSFDGIKILKFINNNSTETVPAKETTLGMSMTFGLTR